jgi:hypothetical protein
MPAAVSLASSDGCIWADVVDTAGSNTPGLHLMFVSVEKKS